MSAPLLVQVYDGLTACVRDLGEEELRGPTRTDWTVAELLLHVLLDAQRVLVSLATPADQAPDTDAVSYWHDWNPAQGDGGAHTRFVRVAASAYSSPRVLVEHWTETAAAAGRAALAAPVDDVLETQGHRLALPDLLSTFVVEGAVHHLDLMTDVPVPAAALTEVRRVLDGLLRGRPPADWSDEDYALKGTGRVPLTDEDRAVLGPLADRFPLLG